MPLVLAVGSVADFFGEGEIGVLQCAHHGRVHANVERFASVGVARRIQHAVQRFCICALRNR